MGQVKLSVQGQKIKQVVGGQKVVSKTLKKPWFDFESLSKYGKSYFTR